MVIRLPMFDIQYLVHLCPGVSLSIRARARVCLVGLWFILFYVLSVWLWLVGVLLLVLFFLFFGKITVTSIINLTNYYNYFIWAKFVIGK